MDLVFPETKQRVAEWAESQDVLGVLLVGSRSHNHADEFSDDDLEVILTDKSAAALTPTDCLDVLITGEGPQRKIIYDAQYMGWSGLVGKLNSTADLDHWPYEQAKVLFDRTGELSDLVPRLAIIRPEFRAARLRHATIDAWTPPYRAAKSIKRGHEAAARLLVARGARALARLVFALEWRWVPLDHWLEAELKTLSDPHSVAPCIVQALLTGDPGELEKGLKLLEPTLLAEGVPGPTGRRDLFLELIHPDNAVDRAIHGLQ
ncbi:MAG: DUF4037 domain-containing protein [Chloroflexota bacterium]